MKRITKLSALALAMLTLSGCDWFDGDDDDAPEPTPPAAESTFVRVHHTAADAPNVNVLVNGDAVLEDVPYQVSSQVLELDANTYEIQVDGILPNDGIAEAVIGPADLTFAADVRYEIFAVGSVADETLAPLVVESDPSAIEDGNIRVQAVHAAEGVPTVDVYVTAAGETPADSEAVATLEFGDDTGALDVPAGEYRVFLTLAGEPSQIAFDSGPLTLDAGADLILAAVLNTGAQAADFPVVLQVADGENTSILRSTDNGGDVRVVHAIADAPEVDILLNNEPSGIENLAYGSATDYVGLDADDYLIDVALNADGTVVIDDFAATIEAGESYSVYAIGSVADNDINLGVIVEDRRSVATEAQLQVVHASYSAGEVDVYLTPTEDISDVDPALTAVPFDIDALVSSGNLSVEPGDYFVTVTATGTKTAAIGPLAVTLAAGGIYTAVAVDDEAGAPTIIALDDLAAE